jgi:CAAX prenyl protease-like protein
VAALALVRRDLPRPALSAGWLPVCAGAGVCALWLLGPSGDGADLAAAIRQLPPAGRWAWIAARVAGSVAVLPLVEELAFRGFLLPWLVSPRFERVPPRAWNVTALLLSSLAFGALHEKWLMGSLAGLAFGAVRLHRGRLGDAVLAHALCNAGLAAAVLAAGRWDLWR